MLYLEDKRISSFDTDDEVLSHDTCFIKGDAVYTSLRTYNKSPFRLDAHLNRLNESANAMGFRLSHEMYEIRGWVIKAIAREFDGDKFVRITATPRHTVITWQDLDINPEDYKGVRAMTVPLVRSRVKVKLRDRKTLDAAYETAEKGGCREALLIHPETFLITEGTRSNIMWMKDGTLFWCNDALNGITQEAVIEIARKLGLTVQRDSLHYDELEKIDELFLTKTSTGPVPIIQVDETTIKDGKPGSKTLQFMTDFAEMTRKNGGKAL